MDNFSPEFTEELSKARDQIQPHLEDAMKLIPEEERSVVEWFLSLAYIRGKADGMDYSLENLKIYDIKALKS